MIQQATSRLVEGRNLSHDEIALTLDEIITGKATPVQTAGFLVALRGKGETVDELADFASTFRQHSIRIEPKVSGRLVDTCGTGGDALKTFNVSTIAAVVAAGAGVPIAKHGNRSVTSKCGSADLLEALGFNLAVEPAKVKDSIEQIGIGFMFAPTFHPAMKQVGPVRKELGIRTIFNLMGPLMNPASANAQVLGVYSDLLTEKVSQVLARLGTEEVMVIHGEGGMDEISVSGRTFVSWLKDGEISTHEYVPVDFGVERSSPDDLGVSSVEESSRLTIDILGGRITKGGKFDMVLVNSAAAIIVGKKANYFGEAIEIARQSLESGAAQKKLEGLIRLSGGDMKRLETHAAA